MINVKEHVGEKHAHFYLRSAIKNNDKKETLIESRKRPRTDTETGVEGTNDQNAIGAVCVADDVRVKDVVKNFPNKNVTYTDVDKKHVLDLYAVVRSVLDEQDYKDVNYPASVITRK